jgi:hypothetical protein
MAYDEAAARLQYLYRQARLRQCTGVMLKDETPQDGVSKVGAKSNPSLVAPD